MQIEIAALCNIDSLEMRSDRESLSLSSDGLSEKKKHRE